MKSVGMNLRLLQDDYQLAVVEIVAVVDVVAVVEIVAVVDVGVVDNVADGIVAVVEGIVASDPPVVHMEQVDQTAAALNEVG